MNSRILPRTGLLAMTCAFVLLAAGCSTTGGRNAGDPAGVAAERIINVPATTSLERNLFATNAALRVGIELPDQVEHDGALSVEQHVLRAQLQKALDDSQHWAGVRLAPRAARPNFDVWVVFTLEQSNGQVIKARLKVEDAAGKRWWDETYAYTTEAHDVDPGNPGLAYQPAFARMANDLSRCQQSLPPHVPPRLREVREMKYAAVFSPKYPVHFPMGPDGLPEIAYKPAEGDVTWALIKKIQVEEDAYLDQVTNLLEAHRVKVGPAYGIISRASRATVIQAQACEDTRAKIAARKMEIEERTNAVNKGNMLYQSVKFVMDLFDVKMDRSAELEIDRIVRDLIRENEKDQALLPQLDARLEYENKQLESVKSRFFKLSQMLGNEARSVSVWLNGELVELSGSVAEQHNHLRRVFNKRYLLENTAPEVALPSATP